MSGLSLCGGFAFYGLGGAAAAVGFADLGDYQTPAVRGAININGGALIRSVPADAHYAYALGGNGDSNLYVVQYSGTVYNAFLAPAISIPSPHTATAFYSCALGQ